MTGNPYPSWFVVIVMVVSAVTAPFRWVGRKIKGG